MQPLCLLNQNPELQKWDKALTKHKSDLIEEVRKLKDRSDSDHKYLWSKMRNELQTMGVLPEDYDPETHTIHVRDGVIFVAKKEENPLGDFLENLMDKVLN